MNYIRIEDGITKIEDNRFMGDETLESIFIPSSVTEIGSRAFFGCKNLKDITLPKGLKSISRAAFYYCRGLRSIVIPKDIRIIEKEVFLECSLNSVVFPQGLEAINDLAFAYNKISTIYLPKNIKELGHGCFYKSKHIVAYNTIEKGLNYAMHNLKPGLAISAIPWIGHRLTLKDFDSEDIIFSVYIAGSYWTPTRNKILNLYNGSSFDIEQYDSLFETIRAIDDKINVSILRLKFPFRLSENYKNIYLSFLRQNTITTVQKVIYENDIKFLRWLDENEFINYENIDKLIATAYEKDDNVEIRAYLLKKKSELMIKKGTDLYL